MPKHKPWDATWTIERELGHGGQGETYLVSSIDGSGAAVLKRLLNKKRQQARARMRLEVLSLQTLSDAGAKVPIVLDNNIDKYLEPPSELYFVMSHIKGPTLTEFIAKEGPQSVDRAFALIESLLPTFELAHELGIVHRDLKPDNIIVQNDTELYLIDFGISFNAAQSEGLTEHAETFRNKFLDLPETNTPGSDMRDPRSDITAIVAVLFFCLTGKLSGQLRDANGKAPHMRPGNELRDFLEEDARAEFINELFDVGFSTNIGNRIQTVSDLSSKVKEIADSKGGIDQLDVSALARTLSKRIRSSDSKTRIEEHRKLSSSILYELKSEGCNHGNLDRFNLQVAQSGGRGGLFGSTLGILFETELPPEYDDLNLSICFGLSLEHHSAVRYFAISIASLETERIILSSQKPDTIKETKGGFGGSRKVLNFQSWKPIFCISDTDVDTDHVNAFRSHFTKWLRDSLRDIFAEVSQQKF